MPLETNSLAPLPSPVSVRTSLSLYLSKGEQARECPYVHCRVGDRHTMGQTNYMQMRGRDSETEKPLPVCRARWATQTPTHKNSLQYGPSLSHGAESHILCPGKSWDYVTCHHSEVMVCFRWPLALDAQFTPICSRFCFFLCHEMASESSPKG